MISSFDKMVVVVLLCGIAAVGARSQSHTNIEGTTTPEAVAKLKCRARVIPQFRNVTSSTGIHFLHSYDPQEKYIAENMGGGVILIDYDRDGWPDIFFTNAPTIDMALHNERVHGSLYHNNHDGTFTDTTVKAAVNKACFGMGGAVGDYNNDGWPDLYLTCMGGNILYRNNGDGTFTDVTAHAGVTDGTFATGAAFGDYDGDGNLDLYVAGYVDFHLDALPKFGTSATCTFRSIPVQCGPRGLKGAPDVLYHNNGDGTFTDVTERSGVTDHALYYGLGVLWSDFDNSGRPSILVANDTTPNYLYRNMGNGTFTDIGEEAGVAVNGDGDEQANMGVSTGDYLHNGLPAIYITTFADEYFPLYRNDGKWNFTDITSIAGTMIPSLPWVGWGTAFFDADNDGWLDLIAVNGHVYPQVDSVPKLTGYREPKLLLMNQGNGTFCNASAQAGSALEELHISRGAAIGDLFHTGNLDVVVEDLDDAPMILKNLGVPGNHWISFQLGGTKSNRLGIGARITLKTEKMVQTAELQSGGSYLSQNDLTVHFGLGVATIISNVEIRWPSGHIDTLKDFGVDQRICILEGTGSVPCQNLMPIAGKHNP